jgi:hypothetical protein
VVAWSATGGTISPDGHYVAGGTGGNFRVIGAVAGTSIVDTVPVRIVRPAATLAKVVVAPDAVALPAGQVKQFGVSGFWNDGTTATPPVDWTATGGTISPAGSYAAGEQDPAVTLPPLPLISIAGDLEIYDDTTRGFALASLLRGKNAALDAIDRASAAVDRALAGA